MTAANNNTEAQQTQEPAKEPAPAQSPLSTAPLSIGLQHPQDQQGNSFKAARPKSTRTNKQMGFQRTMTLTQSRSLDLDMQDRGSKDDSQLCWAQNATATVTTARPHFVSAHKPLGSRLNRKNYFTERSRGGKKEARASIEVVQTPSASENVQRASASLPPPSTAPSNGSSEPSQRQQVQHAPSSKTVLPPPPCPAVLTKNNSQVPPLAEHSIQMMAPPVQQDACTNASLPPPLGTPQTSNSDSQQQQQQQQQQLPTSPPPSIENMCQRQSTVDPPLQGSLQQPLYQYQQPQSPQEQQQEQQQPKEDLGDLQSNGLHWDWIELTDKVSGKPYYFSAYTQVNQWERPERPAVCLFTCFWFLSLCIHFFMPDLSYSPFFAIVLSRTCLIHRCIETASEWLDCMLGFDDKQVLFPKRSTWSDRLESAPFVNVNIFYSQAS